MAKICYVNAASSGGDGTTNATSGGTAAYASLRAAELAERGDLSTIGKMTFSCEGTTEDTLSVDFLVANWTNASATDYIEVVASGTGEHDGTAGSGYSISTTSGHVIEINVPYTRIGSVSTGRGIEIISKSSTSSDEGIRFNSNSGDDLLDCYAVGNIIRSTTSTASKDGIYLNPSSGSDTITVHAYNNIIYGFNRAGIHAQKYQGAAGMTLNAYHNTMYDNGVADIRAQEDSGTVVINAHNNLAASTVSFSDHSAGPTWNGSNNVTIDASYNHDLMTAGAQATDGVAVVTKSTGSWVVFTNITASSEDFSLLDEAAGNKPVGFGSNQTSVIAYDCVGEAYSTTPDCGGFEFVTVATPVPGLRYNLKDITGADETAITGITAEWWNTDISAARTGSITATVEDAPTGMVTIEHASLPAIGGTDVKRVILTQGTGAARKGKPIEDSVIVDLNNGASESK